MSEFEIVKNPETGELEKRPVSGKPEKGDMNHDTLEPLRQSGSLDVTDVTGAITEVPVPVLKRAVTRRQRGPHTYDFLLEVHGCVFGCDELRDASKVDDKIQHIGKERKAISKALNAAKTEEEVNALAERLNALGDEHNAVCDDVITRCLKGDGEPGGEVCLIPEAERADWVSRAVKADLVSLIIHRSTLTGSDVGFLSKPSKR